MKRNKMPRFVIFLISILILSEIYIFTSSASVQTRVNVVIPETIKCIVDKNEDENIIMTGNSFTTEIKNKEFWGKPYVENQESFLFYIFSFLFNVFLRKITKC